MLDGFSRTLTAKVIEFCGSEVTSTENELSATAEKLRTMTTKTEFSKIVATVATNEKSRRNELIARKNRKFYRLKYNNNNNNRSEQNENGRTTDGPRNENRAPRSDNRRRNEPRRGNDRYHDRYQNNREFEYTSTSETDQTDQSDQETSDRLLAVIERRNNNRRTNNRREPRNDSSENRHQERQERQAPSRPSRPTQDMNQQRTADTHDHRSYASAARNQNGSGPSTDRQYDSRREPIHERISRRNSRNNFARTQTQEQPPNPLVNDPREAELENLRARLRTYEDQNRTLTNPNNIPIQSSKNEKGAQRETGQNPNELSEMRTYLAGVMDAIRGFESKLATQQDTEPTPSDRL